MIRKQDTVLMVGETVSLLDFLVSKMGGMSRTSVKQLISQRRVSVAGAVQPRGDYTLMKGDKVVVSAGRGNTTLNHPKLSVIYEDEHLIVVYKRPGLLTMPTRPESSETTALSILRAYVRRENRKNSVFVAHRLDRETSGVLVFARTQALQEYMRTYWRQLVTERTYIALVEGELPQKEGTVTSWLTEDKRNAMVYSSPTDNGGQKAVTHYKTLRVSHQASDAGGQTTDSPEQKSFVHRTSSLCTSIYSLVELHLETGRTNQIRVHMQSLGHPVVGDRKYGYGNEYSPIDRLCLHAKVLAFIHPVTEKKVRFEAPVPKEFNRVLA
ncbi:MAG: RluA family pseudouridine synthase [Paludibacteraceae bacterium]|nr:RluA family pseudouridine synthase [Paludibacteraceae bacterium]